MLDSQAVSGAEVSLMYTLKDMSSRISWIALAIYDCECIIVMTCADAAHTPNQQAVALSARCQDTGTYIAKQTIIR